MKTVRFILGILLVPVCVAATGTVISLIEAIQPSSRATVAPSVWALGGGVLLWVFLYFTLPRPARSYVLAHELTHALWAWVMGAKVSGMRVSRESGSVTLTKNNFIITLAPYFFPLYTVIVIVSYCILSVFFDVEAYYLCWLALVGLTWGFHLTFTISTLLDRQSDVREYGRLFSYMTIYLLNVLGVSLWVVAVSSPTLEQMVQLMNMNLGTIACLLWREIGSILAKFGQ